MQMRGAIPPVGIVFDSDLVHRIDSVLALALLFGFDTKNEIRLASMSVSTPDLNAARYCDALGKFYAAGGFSRLMPIGMADGKAVTQDATLLTGPLAKKTPEGKPAYPQTIQNLNDTAEVAPLLRNALTAQHDKNCIVVLAGPATNLARTLALPGAKDWIASKVKFLSVAAGAYANGPAEDHIRADIASAKKLFAEWPTPIVAAGSEASEGVLYPAASIEADFAYTPNHPVADAYRAWKTMPYDAPTHDMSAALYAVRPQESYFKLSEPGTITVLDDGRTQFAPSADGKHKHLIADPAQRDRILKTYTELVSAKPMAKARPRGPVVEEKKVDKAKDPQKP